MSIYKGDKLIAGGSVIGGVSRYKGKEHTTGLGSTPGIEIVTLPKGHKYIIVAHFELSNDIFQTTVNVNGTLYVDNVYQVIKFNPSAGGGAIAVLLAEVTDNDAVVRCKAYNSSDKAFDFMYEVQVMTLA